MSSQGRDKQEGYSNFRGFLIPRFWMTTSCPRGNVMKCRGLEDDKTHPLYIINIRLGRQQTTALSQWQPAISLFMSLYCNPPIAHDMNDVQCVNGRPQHLENFRYSLPTGVWVVLRPLRFDQRMMKETRPTA